MSKPENSSREPKRCAQCGVELPEQLSSDLCPKCLLKAAMEPGGPGQGATEVVKATGLKPVPHTATADSLQDGEQFGHYRVIRTLGGGGMGTVFEAEDLENARRVALKLLSHSLDSPEGRQRFFREGRLAASINHPNSVYVFGTEEIGGTPAIAMEFVPGGTLEERVRARGPMSPGEAVDAVLQIIAGLEAAERVGILHRDVKPSNCYVDADGTVKIGDFGLSISTAIRTEPALTATGSFLGTPAFCSPEQLRGEELTPRSDIYSVGATLFYLLTGRTPYAAKNVVALIATILENPAPSPQQVRRDVPAGLARVVQRCLKKHPDDRFKNYRELRQALAPFSSAAPVPAMLALRFAAGLLDFVTLSLVSLAICSVSALDMTKALERSPQDSWGWMIMTFVGVSGSILYYALFEGLRGAAVGKAICRLRVVGRGKSAPGFRRALLRAVIYALAPVLPIWVVYGSHPSDWFLSSNWSQYLTSFSFYVMLALLFVTARRRNGYAALHDLASGTRVISKVALEVRPALAADDAPPADIAARRSIGPYHVLETLEETPASTWLLAYDLRLLRKVWVRTSMPGTPPYAPHLRHIGRVGRLRWLTGRRTDSENWDAFEAPSGKSLLELIREPQPWGKVRFWLLDLAQECSAAEKDQTMPEVLALDRIWITAEGRAKLLDFPAPGLGRSDAAKSLPLVPSGNPEPPLPGPGAVQKFLSDVACAALTGSRTDLPHVRSLSPIHQSTDLTETPALPLPLHAREFLLKLPTWERTDELIAALRPLFHRSAEVTRARRAVLVAGCLALPLVASIGVHIGLSMLEQWEKRYPGLLQLNMLLSDRWARNMLGNAGPSDEDLSVYVASHYAHLITNRTTWSSMLAVSLVKGEARKFAERSLVEHPDPSPEEVKKAEAAVGPRLPKPDLSQLTRNSFFPFMIFSATLWFYVGLPAMLAALLFRGGLLLYVTGVTFVRRDGLRASRLRIFWRSVVAWAPLWLIFFVSAMNMEKPGTWSVPVVCTLVLALTLASLWLPRRGVPDRLAGTWPVPR